MRENEGKKSIGDDTFKLFTIHQYLTLVVEVLLKKE